jgi:Ca2+-binding EF-hand superfamily protein
MVVDIDDVLKEIIDCYMLNKANVGVGGVAKFALKFKMKAGKHKTAATDDEEEDFSNKEDDFVDYDDLLSEGDTVISRMNDLNDSHAKVLTVNSLRERLGETMGAYFLSSQTTMVRRCVQSSIEVRSGVQRHRIAAVKNFRKLDKDGDGHLSLEEVLSGARILGMSQEQAQAFFEKLDVDGSGDVDMDEFFAAFHDMENSLDQNAEEEKKTKLENIMLPIDPRPPGSRRVLSVDTKKLELQRAHEEQEDARSKKTRRRTTVFGWSKDKREHPNDAPNGAITILKHSTYQVVHSSKWVDHCGDNGGSGSDDDLSIASAEALRDLERAGTAKDFHSSLLFDSFRQMDLRQHTLTQVPHLRACAAYLKECNQQFIFPKPIFDYFKPRPDYDEDDDADDMCICGHAYKVCANYCKRCGTKRESMPFTQPLVIEANTFAECECGFRHIGNARCCIKCGKRRAPYTGDHLQCGCGNYFLGTSIFCRSCGAKRPYDGASFGSIARRIRAQQRLIGSETCSTAQAGRLYVLPAHLMDTVSEEDRQLWEEKFRAVDSSGDGLLDPEELGVILRAMFPLEVEQYSDMKVLEAIVAGSDDDDSGT